MNAASVHHIGTLLTSGVARPLCVTYLSQTSQIAAAEVCCFMQMLAREGKQKAIDAKQAEAKKAEQARQAQAVAAREAKAKAEADALKDKARRAQEARQQQVSISGGPQHYLTFEEFATVV